MASRFNPTVQSTWTLVILAIFSVLIFWWASASRSFVQQDYYEEKLAAAELMQQAIDEIRSYRMEKGVFVDHVNDPNKTTLIGQKYSLITTDRGDLDSKLTVTNPNFAAVIVEMMKKAELDSGANIAVAFTGSMPGANIAVLSACEILGVRPWIITSVGASMWGANDPNFTWLDMEQFLYDRNIINYRSFAASVGGGSDRGRRLSPRGRELLQDAIQRNNVLFIDEETLSESVDRRIALLDSISAKSDLRAYLNVGGGAASLGHSINGRLIGSGVRKRLSMQRYESIGAMIHYGMKGLPVINVQHIDDIAKEYGLPVAPVPMPEVGTGDVFVEERYNLAITWIALLGVVGALSFVGYHSQKRIRLADKGVEPESLL